MYRCSGVRCRPAPPEGPSRTPAQSGGRQPGLEIVLEVDDVAAERDRVVAAGWPLEEDLANRPWGLTHFRIIDPDGYYLRITSR